MRAVFVPGMATDARLFAPQRDLPFDFVVPDWPAPQPDDTLERYAARMAASIGRADLVAGVSFGGMLAQAMAPSLGARLVVGIATARRGDDIPPFFRFLETLASSIPALASSQGRLLVDIGVAHMRLAHKQAILAMLRDSPIDLIRASSRMILRWPGSPSPCPARFIHGGRDFVIPAKRVKPDRVVARGGHLINMSHAAEVNAFIVHCAREAALL